MDIKEQQMKGKVGFIGAGNMAEAIASSLIRTGFCSPDQIIVSAPSDRNKSNWPEPMTFVHENSKVIEQADYVYFAMKPQFLDNAVKTLVDAKVKLNSSKAILSILAGVDVPSLRKKLSPLIPNSSDSPTIIRLMPNTSIKYGEGITGIVLGEEKNKEHLRVAERLAAQGGTVEKIPESLMNAFGATAGSGCAYLFVVMEAIADGAVKQGIPRDMALRIGAQLFKGAGELVQKELLTSPSPSQAHPAVLRDSICSPGGSTIVGVHELEKSGVRNAFINAIGSARHRNQELGDIAAKSG